MKSMKSGIRIVGIDDSPFEKHGPGKKVLVVGVVQRRSIIEGVISSQVIKDGSDATKKIIEMIHESRFLPQVRLVLMNGIMLAGFNVVDINKLSKGIGVPVIALTRRKPDMSSVISALKKSSKTRKEYERKSTIINKAGLSAAVTINSEIAGLNKAYIQTAGIDVEEAKVLLNRFGVGPLRLAHIIGSGVIKGESSGRI